MSALISKNKAWNYTVVQVELARDEDRKGNDDRFRYDLN